MLTNDEYYGLMQREWVCMVMGSYSCGLCQYRDHDDILCIFRDCQKFKDNFFDAAEFEARVAAKLALTFGGPQPCERGEIKHCPYESNGMRAVITCKWCRLKQARLAVEEEMEK